MSGKKRSVKEPRARLMRYRAAMIGCGKIGSEFADDPKIAGIYTHAGAYRACGLTELAAVADTDPGKLARCGRRWDVRACYTDPAEMLARERPEIVSVCTPDATHVAMIKMALHAPGVRAILAEKPLALDLESARGLVRQASDRGVLLAVNYSRRHDAGHARLREFIADGELGALRAVSGFYTKGTLHNGTHWFDLIRYLAGNVDEAWGFSRPGEAGDDPTLDAFLRLQSGATAHLQGGDASEFNLFEMDLVGSMGRARIVELGHRIEIHARADSPHATGYRTLVPVAEWGGGMRDLLLHAVEDLANALREGRPPRCSGEDAVEALRIGLAVIESARTGAPVRLEPPA